MLLSTLDNITKDCLALQDILFSDFACSYAPVSQTILEEIDSLDNPFPFKNSPVSNFPTDLDIPY